MDVGRGDGGVAHANDDLVQPAHDVARGVEALHRGLAVRIHPHRGVAVLLGAEINAEMEKQTVKDTTTGPDKPLGERDAVKADLLPSEPDPDPETLKKR